MTYRHGDLLRAQSPAADAIALDARIRAALRGLAAILARRRSRRALAALDDRLLRDIGLTRDQAQAEVARSIWDGRRRDLFF